MSIHDDDFLNVDIDSVWEDEHLDDVVMNHDKKHEELTNLLSEAVGYGSAETKQWYLEEIAKLFHVDLPEHEEGVVP